MSSCVPVSYTHLQYSSLYSKRRFTLLEFRCSLHPPPNSDYIDPILSNQYRPLNLTLVTCISVQEIKAILPLCFPFRNSQNRSPYCNLRNNVLLSSCVEIIITVYFLSKTEFNTKIMKLIFPL